MAGFFDPPTRTAGPLTREEFERAVANPPKPLPTVIVLSPRLIEVVRRRWPEMFR